MAARSSSASATAPASKSSFASLLSKTKDSSSASEAIPGGGFAAYASTSGFASALSKPTGSASASTSGHSIFKSTSVLEDSPKGAFDSDKHEDSAPVPALAPVVNTKPVEGKSIAIHFFLVSYVRLLG